MPFLTLFLLTSNFLLNSPLVEVNNAVQKVVIEAGYDIAYQDENTIVTEIAEININDLNKYIIEEFPNENPGWTQARVQIFVKLQQVDTQKTEIKIYAGFERFGTPSALLLIPPHWRSAQSNGNLEKELMDKINEILKTMEER